MVSREATTPQSADTESAESGAVQCDFLICATHFLGDGMALHQFANDFFGLLGSRSTMSELATTLSSEWQSRCAKVLVSLYAQVIFNIWLKLYRPTYPLPWKIGYHRPTENSAV